MTRAVRLNLPQKGLILVCVPLVFELIFVGVLTLLLQQAEVEIQKEARATMVLATANQFVTLFHDAASKLIEFGLTKNENTLRQYDELIKEYPIRCAKLRDIVKDSPTEVQVIDKMERACDEGVELLNMHKQQLVGGGRLEALRRFRADRTQVKDLIDRLVTQTKLLAAQENAALSSGPTGKSAARQRVQQFIFLGVAGNMVLAISLALYFMQNVVKRLGTLTDNTVRLAKGTALNPPLAGEDEIANLDSVFHEMAAALTEAAAKERAMTDSARASESRVRSIIDSMPVGLLIASSDGIIESANPRMEEVFGYSAAELFGRNLVEFFPSADTASFSDLAARHKERAVGGTAEWQAQRADGTRFPAELELNDFSTQDGERILAIIEDISERHEVEKLKKEFVAMVSHELRTPLTSIRGSLGLLAAGKLGDLSEKAQRAVTIAERNTVRLAALINDILDLEKLESGKMEMHFEPVDVSTVIERSLDSVRAFADSNEVALKVEANGSTASLNADGDRLVQVVVNLLSNAVKFSPKGSAVTVSVSETPDWVTIKVIDRGRGIPATHKDLIFERFQQVEQSDAKKKGGSGLGLAICKAIIEQHGGRIGVDSEEGKGSQFWFRVPARPAA